MKTTDYKMLFCLVDLSLISPRLAFEAICMAKETGRDIASLLTEGDPTDMQRHLSEVIEGLRRQLEGEPDDWPRPTNYLADPKEIRE